MKLIAKYIDAGVHPVIGRTLHRFMIAEGSESDRYQRYIGDTLGMLIRDASECAAFFRVLEVAEKTGTTELFEGEDTDVTFADGYAQVDITLSEELINNPEGRFPISVFKKAAQGWCEFLHLPYALESMVVVDLGDAESAAGCEHVQLRCEAGQPCPKEGWWFTPARSDSRRLLKVGEIMPSLGGDYGATIWQWDERQG